MTLFAPAKECLRNQRIHKALNALIKPRPLEDVSRQGWGAVQNTHEGEGIVEKEGDEMKEAARSPRIHMTHQDPASYSGLNGKVIVLKDNICTTEEPTTCASAILEDFHSPFAATVVAKLKAAGAIIGGKSNLDEFGMGSDSTNSVHGAVRNLYTRDGETLSAGGSSGGSAVAVASDQCFAALGTDTGGSVRLPAAYTGLVGFKPSYGLVSRWGVVAYANSLDTVGILAKNVMIAKQVFDVIEGYDQRDATSISASTRSRIRQGLLRRSRKRREKDQKFFSIGVPQEYNTAEIHPIVRQAWIDILQDLGNKGHSIIPISLPATKIALPAYYVLAPAEASSNLAKFDGVRYGLNSMQQEREDDVLYAGRRRAGFGDEVRRRILLGSYDLSAAAIDNYFIRAQKVRRLVQQDFNNVFQLQNPLLEQLQAPELALDRKVDVIITPTAQALPPKLNCLEGRDPLEAYNADVLTVPASLAGLPAMSVPIAIPTVSRNNDNEINTVGMQIVGQYGDEDMVTLMAMKVESLSKRQNQ